MSNQESLLLKLSMYSRLEYSRLEGLDTETIVSMSEENKIDNARSNTDGIQFDACD